MKRILGWIGTIAAFFLLWGCVEGMNGADVLDFEGGSEAGNPPAGDRPVSPPEDHPYDHYPCKEEGKDPDCIPNIPREDEQHKDEAPLATGDLVEKINSLDESILTLKPHIREILQERLDEESLDE